MNAAALGISGAGHDVSIGFLLLANELRHELRMMREIGVHQEHEFSCAFRETVNVGGAETHFAGSCMKNNLLCAIYPLQFFDDILSAVWRVVINNDYFHVELAKKWF